MQELSYLFASGTADIDEAFSIRIEVFTGEQGVPLEEEIDEYDERAVHLLVREGREPVATARLFFPNSGEACIGRMAVRKGYRRHGVGRRIIGLLCQEAKKRGAGKVVLHAQWQARPFYCACGFREVGEAFMEANIKHILMEKPL
jgi:predicted GNAT family N-acyltransferase